jgi:hypothetical protein
VSRPTVAQRFRELTPGGVIDRLEEELLEARKVARRFRAILFEMETGGDMRVSALMAELEPYYLWLREED